MKVDVLELPVARPTRAADLVALAKPRLNLLVVITAVVGYYVGAAGSTHFLTLVNTMIGTAMVAAAASAFNQIYERDVDALMERTRTRPLPDGRLQPAEARRFGIGMALTGLLQLALGANPLAALVALSTLVTYVAIYTPLKQRTPFATVVGAVPGALPPVIGWAAARDNLAAPGWSLFLIVFLWQMPHFLAIAWMYKEQYRDAGIPLLPVVEPDGRSTARQALLYAAALVPVSLTPTILGVAGRVYFTGALVLSLCLLALAVRFARGRERSTARALFLGSIIYLPILWILLLGNLID